MAHFWWQPFAGSIFSWWLTVSILGWLSFPLVYRCLVLLPDRGLSVSKLLGIILPVFFFATVSSRFGLRGSEHLLFTLLLALGVINVFLLTRSYQEIGRFLLTRWRSILAYEMAFLGSFVLYLWFRSYLPDATFDATGFYGAEKWDNLAFLTSIWRNMSVPPADPWLAGFRANYYTFSHLVWAVLARLSGTEPQVAFNLGLGTLFALLITMSFGLGHIITERKSGGWWALFLVAFAGTAATWSQMPEILYAIKVYGVKVGLSSFNFWTPSDVLPNTRNEFPAFNWLLGDLHAHAFGILIFLAAIAVLVQLQLAKEVDGSNWRQSVVVHPLTWILLAVLFATMWATNSWDMLVFGALGWGWILSESAVRENDAQGRLAQAVQGTLIWTILVLVAISILASFYSRYTYPPLIIRHPALDNLPSVLKTLASIGYVDQSMRTTPGQWFGFWGILAITGLLLQITNYQLRVTKNKKDISLERKSRIEIFLNSPLAAALSVGALLCLIAFHFVNDFPWVGVGLFIGLVICARELLRLRTHGPARWAILLLAGSLFCQIIPEFIFIDDPIDEPFQRYNTVFKLYYSAWVLAALSLSILMSVNFRPGKLIKSESYTSPLFGHDDASGISIEASDIDPLPKNNAFSRGGRRMFVLISLVLLIGAGIYPVLGVASRVQDGLNRMAEAKEKGMAPKELRNACRTLDGLAFMALPQYGAEDDLRLGLWMRTNLPRAERIAEATGHSYTMTGRMAVISGIPSFMGWAQHESQWRGAAFDQIYQQRLSDLRILYTSPNLEETLEICRNNNLRYVVVGTLERQQFPADRLAKFNKIGRVVKQFGRSVLYQVDFGK